MTFLLLVLALVLILLGAPIAVALGAIALGLMIGDTGLDIQRLEFFAKRMTDKLNQQTLLAIPFFVISGSIMAQGTMARRLVQIARGLTGWLPNGLGVSAVFACVLFAAVSGSSPATVVAVGAIMVPALLKAGYNKPFTVGLLTSAGSLGILIPPSIPMVIYGVITGESIAELFLAGLGAGIVMGVLFTLFVMVLGGLAKLKPGQAVESVTLSGVETTMDLDDPALNTGFRPFLEGALALFMPVVVLGSIYTGVATATEAAALSVVYALVVEGFMKVAYKEGSLKDFYDALVKPSVVVGTVLIIVGFSQVLNYQLAVDQVPDELAKMITAGVDTSAGAGQWEQIKFLILLNLLLLVIGCLMDIISAILVFVPLILPAAHALGIDPILLGTIVIVNLEMGYLTPPIGLNLFVSSSLFNQPVLSVMKWVVPFVLMMLVGLVLIMVWPALVLTLPGLYGGGVGG